MVFPISTNSAQKIHSAKTHRVVGNSGLTVPGYNYLGPGNSVIHDDPVNQTDAIAQIHDIAYYRAKGPKDIRRADKVAIKKFWAEFSESSTPGAFIGWEGITDKYVLESVTGVLYPRTFDGGDSRAMFYAARQNAISKLWHKEKKNWKNSGKNYIQFLKEHPQVRELYKSYSKGGEGYKRLLADKHGGGAGTSHTGGPSDTGNQPGPSTAAPTTIDEVVDSNFDSFDLDEFINSIDIGGDTGAIGTGGTAVNENMDVDNTTEAQQQNAGGGSGGRTAGAHSTQATGGGLKYLPRVKSVETYSSTYRKTRILFSYGFANVTISQHKAKDTDTYVSTDYCTTPLSLIPVDWLPFYMTPGEFNNLPVNAAATSCRCKVTCVGTRVAFDHGTSISGTATSEYIPIGLKAIGLNIRSYGKNITYITDAADPMKPTEIKTMDLDNMIGKYYEHSSSNIMNVPRSNSNFWVHEWNKSSLPDNAPTDYLLHQEGMFRQDENIDSFMINNCVGDVIIDYSYSIKAGALKSPKQHWIPYSRKNADIYLSRPLAKAGIIEYFKDKDKKMITGRLGISKERSMISSINNITAGYKQQLENYGVHNPITGPLITSPQPQVHVGLLATPQLNPATEDTTFLNSAVYWLVECELDVSASHSSAFTKGNLVSYPTEVKFYPNDTKKYTNGETLFGVNDTDSGNLGWSTSLQEMLPLPSKTGSTTILSGGTTSDDGSEISGFSNIRINVPKRKNKI